MMSASVSTCLTRQVSITDTLKAYPAKLLARWAGASVSTAEKWRCGQREPSGSALLELMRQNTELAEKLLGDP